MNIKMFAALALFANGLFALAGNTKTSTAQVTSGVALTTDVDYIITGDTPFTAAGSVDIKNVDHAVVIIQKYKPSKVIANYLGHIYINGEAAVEGTNCQVRMYNRGAIILPYDKDIRPLTCYTEENFGGDTYNNYTEGSSGGFMKSLTTATLNNKIKSFKLKRGYMVTFAVGTAGWGYSRCFIADNADLEINVPQPLTGKISSYRIFKWWNAHKAGGASSGSAEFNTAINASWCYDWAQGNASLLPDVEWVPNHIYEDWPSASACGSVTGSCHMKTNNEPGNSADDHPQSVDVVLGNWQNLMRTGMRLCSESSHDGSWSHLQAFIDSIDARGWRCDLLDLHCYWGAGSFNDFSGYYNKYGGRPVWISEWMWGASWNSGNWSSGGIFAQAPDGPGSFSTSNQQCMYNNTKPILDKLNASPYVERYAFWNGENVASKIYYNGELSLLGKYYATMDDGLGYNASIQKVPNIVYKAPYNFTGTYTKKTGTVDLEWKDPNWDMVDSVVVEYLPPTSLTQWKKLGNVKLQDKSSGDDAAYTFKADCKEVGLNKFRISTYYTNASTNKATRILSDTFEVTVSAASATGSVQYGQLKIANGDVIQSDIVEQDVAPYVVLGMMSNKNTANAASPHVNNMLKTSFKARLNPWTLPEAFSFEKTETVDYLVLHADTVIHMSDDFMLMSQSAGSLKDETHVTFPEAFPEGITPVVVGQQVYSMNAAPTTVKIYNVTNTGFDVKLVRQEGITTTFNKQKVVYFACTPGQVSIGGGKLLSAGINTKTPVGGTSRQTVEFLGKDDVQMSLLNPFIIAAPQTHNYPATSIFRLNTTNKDADGGVISGSIRRQIDGSTTTTETNKAATNGDYIGYIIVSDDPEGSESDPPVITTAIRDVESATLKGFNISTQGHMISTDAKGVQAYNAAGQRVSLNRQLPAGIYLVKRGKQTVKVTVK